MVLRSLFLVLLLPAMAFAEREYNWEKLEGCTLAQGWQDGDSFTVRIRPRTFRVFRLYFVDTPEDGADKRFPERIKEQADYFGVSPDRVVKIGDQAAAYTRMLLSQSPSWFTPCGRTPLVRARNSAFLP
jgi:endonuclease YncB( thermonuclease family)